MSDIGAHGAAAVDAEDDGQFRRTLQRSIDELRSWPVRSYVDCLWSAGVRYAGHGLRLMQVFCALVMLRRGRCGSQLPASPSRSASQAA
jgi:hypothetical protein